MTETLVEGLSVMLVGMGTVLLFLCILVAAMILMAKIVQYVNKIFPEPVPVSATKTKKTNSNDEEIAVAIVSAMCTKR